MALLSVAIIVKNAEDTIERLVASCKQFADDIVIVDTGSTDKTLELISKEPPVKVFNFEWCDDFSAARNFAFSKCKNQWIMWLDADDVVPEVSIAAINTAKETLLNENQLIQVFCPYHLTFNEDGTPRFKTMRERIVNTMNGGQWIGAVHEYFNPFNQLMGEYDATNNYIIIEHRPVKTTSEKDPLRNLRILINEGLKHAKEGTIDARNTFYLANEYKDIGQYANAIATYKVFLEQGYCEWEKYYVLQQMAFCYKQPDTYNSTEWFNCLTAATQLLPERAEAWFELGYHYYSSEEFKKAMPYFAAAEHCELPTSGFIRTEVYEHLAADLFSVCLHRCGYHDLAIRYAKVAYYRSPDKKRIISNIEFYMEALAEQKKGYLNA